MDNLEIRVLLRQYWRQNLKAADAARKICEVKGEGVSIRAAQKWFKRFNDGNTSVEDQPRSGRPTSINSQALLESIKANPSTSTRKLSSELRISQRSVVRHLHSLRKVNKRPRKRPQVYVTRPDVAEIGLKVLQAECDVTSWTKPVPVPREELLSNIVGKDALYCALTDKIDKELLDKAGSNLKVISTISVGYDHIDIEECKKRGIRIGYTPDVLTDATAELTMALLLATNRRLFEANKEVYNGGWKAWSPSWMCGPGLKSSTVGVFGFGRIGQEVAKRIVPFKPAQLLYNSRNERKQEANEIGAKYVPFDELLKQSDVLIVCAALNEDTTLKFNAEAFDKMKSNAIFINTSRGGLVDQKALYTVLKDKRIYAAGLDVTTPEPLPLDEPLLTLPNCVILPHIGSADINTRIEMSRITACNILSALKGEEMIAEVV